MLLFIYKHLFAYSKSSFGPYKQQINRNVAATDATLRNRKGLSKEWNRTTHADVVRDYARLCCTRAQMSMRFRTMPVYAVSRRTRTTHAKAVHDHTCQRPRMTKRYVNHARQCGPTKHVNVFRPSVSECGPGPRMSVRSQRGPQPRPQTMRCVASARTVGKITTALRVMMSASTASVCQPCMSRSCRSLEASSELHDKFRVCSGEIKGNWFNEMREL